MRKSVVIVCVSSLVSVSVQACDLCAVYSATEAQGSKPGFYLGAFEQFTHFGTMQQDGEGVKNETGQFMDSFITQTIVGYRFNHRLGLQLNVPYIVRSFKRPEPTSPTTFKVERGTENGLGDVTLIGNARVYERISENSAFFLDALGGVKFPTGQSDRLREELNEVEEPGAPESGIHGHDLALGSGSFDGIVGGSAFASWKRFFATASLQYAIRSEGAIGYRYANDLMWNGGPGVYLWLRHQSSVSLQCNISGEHKEKDEMHGMTMADTAMTSVYLGPEFAFTWKENLSADLGVDLPVLLDNSAMQLVPDYRIRAGVTWRF